MLSFPEYVAIQGACEELAQRYEQRRQQSPRRTQPPADTYCVRCDNIPYYCECTQGFLWRRP